MEKGTLILSTAKRHFGRYGYSKTTMDGIARDCGLTKPTLYSYFAGKYELFKAVVDSEQQVCYGQIEEALQDVQTSSEKLRVYAIFQVEGIKKFILLSELSKQAILDFHPDVFNVYDTYRKKEETFIAQWIKEGIEKKEFSQMDPHNAARIFYVLVAAVKFDVLIKHASIDDLDPFLAELTNEIKIAVNIFLNGILNKSH